MDEGINASLNEIKEVLTGNNEKLDTLKAEFLSLQSEVQDIQLTLENVTNRNIKLIAEGHLDFSRKLKEVTELDEERALLLVRVNILENDVRNLKARLSKTA